MSDDMETVLPLSESMEEFKDASRRTEVESPAPVVDRLVC